MDATLAERALHALAGHAPSSEASCCPGWHYCRGYVLAGVSRWQTRALAVCALIWSLGAQAVTLHIFTEAQYDGCDGQCEACTDPAAPQRGSVAFDFALYCDDEWKAVSLGVLYFLPGWFLGAALMGAASDRYGRRPALLASLVVSVLSTLGSAVAPGFATYALARTLMGFAYGGTGVVSYVLGCELMPADWLSIIGVGFFNVYFVLGEAGIVAVAVAVKSWRLLTGVVGAQALLCLPLTLFLMPESPKWLISQGRGDEAKAILLAAARSDGPAAVSAMGQVIYEERDNGGGEGGAASEAEEGSSNISRATSTSGDVSSRAQAGGVSGLFRKPVMALMTVCVCFSWLTVGAVYYGINNIAGDLPGSLYSNALLSALVEFPGTILGNILVDIPALGRKLSTVGLFTLAGGACVVAAFVGGEVRTMVAYVGKLGISAAFCAVYVYSTELFATPSRNAGLGLGSQMARVGSGAATGLVTAISVDYAMIIFAGLSALAAVGVQLVLVETYGSPLPETVEEVLAKRRKDRQGGRSTAHGGVSDEATLLARPP